MQAAPAGAQLPSNRALSAEYAASPVTVQKAMRQLVALGLVESRPGVGTFVRSRRTVQAAGYGWQTGALGVQLSRSPLLPSAQRLATPDAIHLHSGYPARELLPERLVRGALVRAARSHHAVSAAPPAGLPELQAWFASEVAAAAPVDVPAPTARDVIVVPGSQSGLASIFRSVVGRGQPLLIESPTYWGAVVAAEQAGVELVPIPTGPNGPDPEEIARALDTTHARAFYAQPTFANPTGSSWPSDTGRQVLNVVRRARAFLIEDDWAHDLAIDAEPVSLLSQDREGHVIYLRTLTKSVSPAIRVGAVIARGPVHARLLSDRAAEGMYVSPFLQAAALDVVTNPAWTRHRRLVRSQLRERRDLLLASLEEHCADVQVRHVPRGGLNLWARLPDGTDIEHVVRESAANGLALGPGNEWFPAEPSGPYLRLNFSSEDPTRFPQAAEILNRVVRDLR